MMTTLERSHTLASLPNSRLKTPMVPGPHTSCVIRISALTQTLSPAWAVGFPAARARIFSVSVIFQIGNETKGYPTKEASSTEFDADVEAIEKPSQESQPQSCLGGQDNGRTDRSNRQSKGKI